MATAADIQAQIAEKQKLLDEQQQRLNYLQDQTERTKRIYEISAANREFLERAAKEAEDKAQKQKERKRFSKFLSFSQLTHLRFP